MQFPALALSEKLMQLLEKEDYLVAIDALDSARVLIRYRSTDSQSLTEYSQAPTKSVLGA